MEHFYQKKKKNEKNLNIYINIPSPWRKLIMRRKIVSILIIALLIFETIQIVNFNKSNTRANLDEGGNPGDNYLDFGYMWNTTSFLASIIHKYPLDMIKKGRYFGSWGDHLASLTLYRNFTRECGFDNDYVRQVQLQNIEGNDLNYSELVEVTVSQLTINHPDFLDETTLSQTAIPQDDYYPIAAVRSNITDPLKSITMDSTFNDIFVINEEDYFQLFPKCEIGINPINLSYSILNDCNITLGNITYVAPEEEIPMHTLQTVFLLDEEQGVEHQIENATDASGIILLKNTSRAYTFQNANNYCLPILRVDTEDEANNQNVTIVKQLLENRSI